MSPEQAKILMELRGYTAMWTTPGREHGGYVKDHESGVTLFAEVSASGNNVELSHVVRGPFGCRISSGQFSLNHPRFGDYEAYVAKAALLVGNSQC